MSETACGDPRAAPRSARWRLLEIDPRSLGLFRIGIGSVLVVDLVQRLGDWRNHYTDWGVMPRDAVLAWIGDSARASLHLWSDAPAWSLGLFAAHLAAAAALALGWHARVATVACWLLTASLHSRDPAVVQGGDNLLRILLFWSMFLPLGARFSLDSRRRRGAAAAPAAMPSLAILLQVCLVYWATVVHKWTPAWLGERSAVAMALELDYLTTSWGRLLAGIPALLPWLTTATVALEAIGPLLAWSPWATGPLRFALVLVFVEFHVLGLGAALHLGLFPWVSACAWLLFLPPWFWWRIARRERREEPATAGGDAPHAPAALRRLRDAMVVALLTWVLLLNLASFDTEGEGISLPPVVQAGARVLGIHQAWQMFAPTPPQEDGWFVMPGLLESGEVVDVWTGGEVRWEKPADVAAAYRNQRWNKLLSNLSMSRYSGLRPPFVRWLCRDWNQRAPSGGRLTRVDLYFVMERFVAPEAPPERLFLLGAVCDLEGAGS
ncbi:MAG TPA: HTTM domain-containing protein [Thermoanaerobaculia bacterium]|nr:HTTM domain-containing protein [Thermoanaerobaculia bacterium]